MTKQKPSLDGFFVARYQNVSGQSAEALVADCLSVAQILDCFAPNGARNDTLFFLNWVAYRKMRISVSLS